MSLRFRPESCLLFLSLSPPQGGPGAEGEPGAVGEPGLKVSDLTAASLSLKSLLSFKLSEKIPTQPASVCPRHQCGRLAAEEPDSLSSPENESGVACFAYLEVQECWRKYQLCVLCVCVCVHRVMSVLPELKGNKARREWGWVTANKAANPFLPRVWVHLNPAGRLFTPPPSPNPKPNKMWDRHPPPPTPWPLTNPLCWPWNRRVRQDYCFFYSTLKLNTIVLGGVEKSGDVDV